jgi:type IV pilus assembly protein PilX
MSMRRGSARAQQRGLVLVSSLLLLLVLTILALAMFRSTGLSERISGNVRDKQRALHAAVVAQQYGEWWLSSNNDASQPPVICNATASANLGANNVLICNNALTNPMTLPWTSAGVPVGVSYFPNSGATAMSFTADANGSLSNTYSAPPSFYIQYVGFAPDGGGKVYKIDAVGYGGSSLSVAVVESTYEIGSGVNNLGGL